MNERTQPVSGPEFFRVIRSESMTFPDAARGTPQLQLSDLWGLSRDRLTKVVPAVKPNIQICVSDRHVRARIRGVEEDPILFELDTANTFAFNRFNGKACIGEISADLAAIMSWEEDQGYASTRSLFLRLVRLGVCEPHNAI